MTHSQEPSLTIIVSSTDSYKDLWANFFKCKNKFWPDCPFKTILVNNEEKPNIPNVEIINCGPDACWSERMRLALNQIDSEYVCFILEDFYITDKVDTKTLLSVLDVMNLNNFKYLKLFSLSKIVTSEFNDFNYLRIIPANYHYGISLTPGIWKKEFMLEKIGSGNYNPWKFEADRLQEEKLADEHDIVGIYDNRNILQLTHMVVQGKYIPSAIKIINSIGIRVSLSDRQKMSFLSYMFYRFKRFIGIKMRKHTWIKTILKPIVKRYSVAYKNS